MTRSYLGSLLFGTAIVLTAAPACEDIGVGDPCTPEQEYNTSFKGFDFKQVNVESKSFQCKTRLCLVNHFQGRVSCPYGQDASGKGNDDAKSCAVPSTDGENKEDQIQGEVKRQCLDRTAKDSVYCSCRCADIDGNTEGGNFCECPDGFACKQLVTSTGLTDEGLTGAYCVKNGTDFNLASACGSECSLPSDKDKCGEDRP